MGFSINFHCSYNSSILLDLYPSWLRQQFFYFKLFVFWSCDLFVSCSGDSWYVSNPGSLSDSCPRHMLKTSFTLCLMTLLIFLAEVKLALSNIENILISALINFVFLLRFSLEVFSMFPFISSNNFSASSLTVSMEPSVWSPSEFSLIILFDSRLSANLSNNKHWIVSSI